MKAPCALCHEIDAYPAACTTTKSETEKYAPRNRRSAVPELPHFGLQASPVPVSLQHRVLDPRQRAFDLIAEGDSQSTAPTLVNGLLKSFVSFL